MKYLKVLLVSFSLFITHLSFACGGWYYSDYYNIYRIDQVLENGTLGLTYHNNRAQFAGSFVDDNLNEWTSFFENKIKWEKLKEIIYNESSYVDARTLNTELSELNTSEKRQFIDYLELAKKSENIATLNSDPWAYEKETPDYEEIGRLIEQIKNKLKTTSNSFYKERYNFQLIKLSYYGRLYKEAINTYVAAFENSSTKSKLKYIALNYKAGAEMALRNVTQGNYDFLKSFNEYDGGRHKAYFSMIYSDEEGFKKTLALCKNNNEKAAFYFIRGANRKSVVLEDFKKVVELAPNSEYAKVLLANEIVKMEHLYWEADNAWGYDDLWVEDVKKIPNEQLMNYIREFIPIVETQSKQFKNDKFWAVSLAYLYTLNKQFGKSDEVLNNISQLSSGIQKQKEAIQLLNYTFTHPNLSIAEENELGKMWYAYNEGRAMGDDDYWGEFMQMRSVNGLVSSMLSKQYKNTNSLKSLLFSGQTIDYYVDEYDGLMKIEDVQALRRELKNSNKTTLLKYGVETFLNRPSDFTKFDNELKEVEATLYMRNPDNLDKAIALFANNDNGKKLKTNPFNANIRDCVWGGWGEDNTCNHKATNYTKASLAKKLLEIKTIAETKNSAMDYYLLGNAYYNMTYYGPVWQALSYHRSGSGLTGFSDCSVALKFYKKAIELFDGNKEMQAKATFMAAKCEQNLYLEHMALIDDYEDLNWWSEEKSKDKIIAYNKRAEAKGYKTYFKKLANYFNDTKYYQEVIDECSYFDIYISN